MGSLRQWASMVEHIYAALPAATFTEEERDESRDPARADPALAEARGLLLLDGVPALGGGGGQG